MKQVIVLLLFLSSFTLFAQRKTYTTTGGEIIFSWASATNNGVNLPTTVRFSPVFNLQTQLHHDLSDKFGILTGFNIRNVGFIYDDPATPGTYYKTRNYTIGLPIGIKVGNMNDRFLFAGYELELPFAYKEKKFVNDERVDEYDEWFSKRTPTLYHSLFLGIGLVEGTQLKFKYYLTNWFNKDYTDGAGLKPFADFNANVFYVALTFQVFRGTKFYYKDTQ